MTVVVTLSPSIVAENSALATVVGNLVATGSNAFPTPILLSNNTVPENSAVGTVVGLLSFAPVIVAPPPVPAPTRQKWEPVQIPTQVAWIAQSARGAPWTP